MYWILLLLPILTTSCHFEITSPYLFQHGSSKAFEMSIGLWAMNIFLFFYIAKLCKDRYNEIARIKEVQKETNNKQNFGGSQ